MADSFAKRGDTVQTERYVYASSLLEEEEKDVRKELMKWCRNEVKTVISTNEELLKSTAEGTKLLETVQTWLNKLQGTLGGILLWLLW